MTKHEENIRIITETTAWNNGQPPDIVWANAGSSYPDLFIDTSMEVQHAQMNINYWAAAYLAQATLKSWLVPNTEKMDAAAAKAAKPRQFIVTSSVACYAGIAGYTQYSVAKAASRSLADNLRSEVNLYNGYRRANPSSRPAADVKIHCVTPGAIDSPGLVQENLSKHPITLILEEGDVLQSEDQVAAAAVKGLEGGGYLISTQWLGNVMRVGMLGGSPRNNMLVDTLLAWVANVAWLFIGPDMEGKVFDWGKKNEVKLPARADGK